MARMIDVAKQANVSIATVSNYITGRKNVSPKTANKIKKAIEDLNYEVNLMARGLKTNKSYNIGVVLPEISSIYFMQIFNGLRDAANGTGYTFSFLSAGYNFEKEKDAVKQLRNQRVEGIILNSCCSVEEKEDWAEEMAHSSSGEQYPIVSLEYDLNNKVSSSIVIKNKQISSECTEYLIKNGRKRILYISAQHDTIVGQERLHGYISALEKANMPVEEELMYEGNLSSLSGYANAKAAIEKGIQFDAIQAVNDQTAVGALKALRESGIDVPDEVAVVGCDNIFPTTLTNPQITTVEIPTYLMGIKSFEIIKEKIENDSFKNVAKVLDHKFIERQSTNKNCASEWNLTRW